MLGIGIYGATYLVPVFLGRVRGYDSLQIGTTVVVTGVAQIMSVAVAARLSQKLDMRIMITAGLGLFAASLWTTSHITPDWGFGALLLPQALRGFATMLCIVPAVQMALFGFEGAELRYASGLFNLMRNLGGAIGIAVVNTWLQDGARLQTARFGETLGQNARGAPDFLAGLAGRFARVTSDPAGAVALARGEFGRLVARYALTQAFDEVFRTMAWMFLIALVMVPFCKPPRIGGPAPSPDAH
ncbi:MAG: MFS transporter [Caulobacteraceae bacterium]